MAHPPGTVAILSGELSRYATFAQSLMALQGNLPPGSRLLWVTGLAIPVAVNRLISEMHGEWVMLMADDHIFPSDLALKLLDHQVDLVSPLCCLRRLPYRPSLFHATAQGFVGYTWAELASVHGLIPVDTYGGACGLIRRAVIEKVGMPFFELMPGQREAPHEDLYTFHKCKLAGFQPYVDLDVRIGHTTAMTLTPHQDQTGRWGVRVIDGQDIALLDPGD